MDRGRGGVKGQEGRAEGFFPPRGFLRTLAGRVLDYLYPPVCLHCGAGVLGPDLLCAICWARLRPITAPLCPRLGIPFEFDMGAGALSAQAISDPPPFERCRSAFVHNGVARKLVSRLKFGDRPDIASFCAGAMALAARELLEPDGPGGGPVLVPVPLHRRRQFGRRYNQSGLLAAELGRRVRLRVRPFAVRRIRPTRPQIGLSAAQRARNVAGAFAASDDVLEQTGGGRVVIVDDVITTGSTVCALTRCLQRAGVERVDVISFSRLVMGSDDSY